MTILESFGRTISFFLVEGITNGLRKATIHGATELVFFTIDLRRHIGGKE